MNVTEKIGWKTEWHIDKWRDSSNRVAELSKQGLTVDEIKALYPDSFIETLRFKGNVALNEGLQQVIDVICGISTPTLWDNSNARVGVGSDATAAQASDTGLKGVSTAFATMDATYPSRTGQVARWKGTFGDGTAEFAWNEFTVDNGAVGS